MVRELRVYLTVAFLLVTLVVSGCGLKGPPKVPKPDTSEPAEAR